MEILAEFKTAYKELRDLIDAGESPGDNEKLLDLIGKNLRLSEEVIQNFSEVPCAERKSVIIMREFVRGLARHILKSVEQNQSES